MVLFSSRLSRATAAFGFGLGVSFANAAAASSVTSELAVKFAGINIAQLKSVYRIDGNAYSIDGAAKTNGLASLFASTRARFRSTGRFSGRAVVPNAHKLTFSQRRKNGVLSLAFQGGNVVDAVVQPKPKVRKGQVPVLAKHLKAVLDPISALVFPVSAADVGNARKICNRTVPVYTGASRMNLRFVLKGTRQVKAQGFSGTAYVCALRYEPVSGHRPTRKDTRFMVANRDMNVTMARIGDSNAYGLFAFRVKTRRGLARGRATTFAAQ
ncbi:MAG: DUF3108 domain-containing protein [Pseudomonadota bacterium]